MDDWPFVLSSTIKSLSIVCWYLCFLYLEGMMVSMKDRSSIVIDFRLFLFLKIVAVTSRLLYFFMFERVQTNTLEPNIKNNVGWNSLLMFPLNLPMCNRSLFVWLWWRYTVIEKYRNNKPTIGTIEPIHWLHHLKVKFIGNRVTSKVVKN
jgi:hypothetical protein